MDKAHAGGNSGFRSRMVASVGIVAAVLVMTSVAWACTAVRGFTWYSDGTTSKFGGSGTGVTAFATGAKPNARFVLVTGNADGPPGHDTHACMFNYEPINPNMRVSSSTGFIGNTTGTINRVQGDWEVCFREPTADTGTAPVIFTVI